MSLPSEILITQASDGDEMEMPSRIAWSFRKLHAKTTRPVCATPESWATTATGFGDCPGSCVLKVHAFVA
jgi:hypothetical protein